MGGKNAMIVDDDADLDEAVVGVVQSAFGYSGQKCSACSRVIVLDGVYDAFVHRLAEAARATPVGPPEDPETVVGPVIDADARDRILRYQAIAASEGRTVLAADPGALAPKGHYVGPMIVADVPPGARVAQEEIFGPILAVIRATDLDDALRIANGTPYALTGGLYSRSPAHIDKVKRKLRVGNVYINRTDHRRPGRPPAVRRLQAVRDRRCQGRRIRIPRRVPPDPRRHREHHAAWVLARGSDRFARARGRRRALTLDPGDFWIEILLEI